MIRNGNIPAVLATGVLFSAACAFGAVTRGPFTQSVDQDSALVGLRLDSACAAQVRYGEGDALDATASSAGPATDHFIPLEGLKPGTSYNFTVEACGSATGKSGSFRTAPAANAARVHFTAIGDMGTGGSQERAVAAAMIKAPPEFWLGIGDVAYNSGTDMEFTTNFFAPLADLLRISPVFTVPGNHEYVTSGAQPYFNAFELPRNNPANSESYYSFDWGPVHVVALDSQCAMSGGGANCSMATQKAWLQTDLAASKAPWKVVMFHHPPYSTGEHLSSTRMRELNPIFEQNGVDLVLNGHDHNFERTKPLIGDQPVAPGTPGAVTYIVAGMGGAGTRAWAASAANWTEYRNNTDYGYLDVQIDGGSLVARFMSTNGNVLDTFTKQKDVPGVPASPELSITVDPNSGVAPLESRFVASGTNGADVVWSFGDGVDATGADVKHTYESPGIYTASASIRDAQGVTHTAATTITVQDSAGNPGPVVEPPPPAEPPANPVIADEGGKSGCASTGIGLVGVPLALLVAATSRRRRRR